jgi:hypothetical protein
LAKSQSAQIEITNLVNKIMNVNGFGQKNDQDRQKGQNLWVNRLKNQEPPGGVGGCLVQKFYCYKLKPP